MSVVPFDARQGKHPAASSPMNVYRGNLPCPAAIFCDSCHEFRFLTPHGKKNCAKVMAPWTARAAGLVREKKHRPETNFQTTPFEGWTDGRGNGRNKFYPPRGKD
jgi:hypothetical protein